MGNIIILAGPQGVGKSTVKNQLISRHQYFPVVPFTTRNQRPNEKDGDEYNFISREKFIEGVQSGRIITPMSLHCNYYGFNAHQFRQINSEKKMVTILKPYTAGWFKHVFKNVFSVFLLPPDEEQLKKRITSRDPKSPLNLMIEENRIDLEYQPFFDLVIESKPVNDIISDIFKNIINRKEFELNYETHK